MIKRTWFGEQLVLAACIAWAVYGKPLPNAVASGVGAIIGWSIWWFMVDPWLSRKLDTKTAHHVDATVFVPEWRMPATERMIEILKSAQRVGENLIDTAQRLVAEAREREAADDSETTVFTRPQPAPVNGSGPALWPMIADELELEARACDKHVYALVAADARARHEFGMAKYGVPLVADNGRDHLVDAYQEALDKIVYLRAHHETTQTINSRSLYTQAWLSAAEIRLMLLTRDGR